MGRVSVCDARRGLLAVDPGSGTVRPLVDRVAGEAMKFCNNAAVTRDGTIFFVELRVVQGRGPCELVVGNASGPVGPTSV